MTHETRIAELLGEWFERQESGDPLDPEELIRLHPELADDLRAHFKLIEVAGGLADGSVPPDDVPERLGVFRIEDELGAGGMGRVFRATGTDEQAVAIKLVHPHLFRSPGFFKRFLREADLGRRVEHENVVRTLDVDAVEIDGKHHHFLVMEYVDGQTLRELLADLERVPEELCRLIAMEICAALAAIHAAGAVHRDLKPENVLITPGQHVKVMDLGVAQLQDEALKLSQTGVFVGSIHYAAPEQFTGGKDGVDARADLHGLGLLLYELAAGRHPYGEGDYPAVMRKILDDEPRRLGDLNPQLSPFFEEVVHRLLAKSPDERFATADELLEVLREGEASSWWKDRAQEIRAITQRPLRRIRVPRETAVYGREDELALLRAKFEQAKVGNGQVLLIEGEAGIGKTRLVDEFVGRLRQDGEDLNFLFGSYPPTGAAVAEGGFSTAFSAHFGEAGSAPYLTERAALVPSFDALLRGEPPPEGAPRLDADALAACVVSAVRGLAAERVTVLLVDDLHFAPEEARSLFASAAMATATERVLLVGTTRHGLPERWRANLVRFGHVEHRALARLGPKDLGDLLQEAFGSERLADELGWQIARKSDGNPFFAMEIIQGLKEGQFLTQRPDGTWVTTQVLEDIQVPSSVVDLVAARLADLDDADRVLLDVASLCGYEFDPLVVSAASGEQRVPALQRLARLEQKRRLVRAVGRRFVFDHHQIQELLRGALAEPLKQEYHALIAQAIEAREVERGHPPEAFAKSVCAELCFHHLRAGCGHAAQPYFERAFEHLRVGGQEARVLELVDSALDVREQFQPDELCLLLLDKDNACRVLGRPEEHLAAHEELRALAAEEELPLKLRERVERNSSILRSMRGESEAARGHAERALALAREAGDVDAEAANIVNLGVQANRRGEVEHGKDFLRSGAELARKCQNRLWECNALITLSGALAQTGSPGEAVAMADEVVRLATASGDALLQAGGHINAGLAHLNGGRLRQALERYERALPVARQRGNRQYESLALGGMGTALLALGRTEEARRLLERQLQLAREMQFAHLEVMALGSVAFMLHRLGEYDEAIDLRSQQIELARSTDQVSAEGDALQSLGAILYARGRLAAARDHVERGEAILQAASARHLTPACAMNVGILQARCGQMDAARASLQRGLEEAAAARNQRLVAAACQSLGSLALEHRQYEEAEEWLSKSAEDTSSMGMHAETARTLCFLGQLEMERGAPDRASDHLQEAEALSREHELPTCRMLSLLHQDRLDTDEGRQAVTAYLENEPAIEFTDRMDLRFLLWQKTHEAQYLEEAKRLLDELVEHAPPEWRESMLEDVRIHRGILEEWEVHGCAREEPPRDA